MGLDHTGGWEALEMKSIDLGYVLEAVLTRPADELDVGVKFIPFQATLTDRKARREDLSCLVGWEGRTHALYYGTVMEGSPIPLNGGKMLL